MARVDFRFFHSLRVRWSEVDMQAVVFNGHYLNYCDVAFTEYWRQTGLPDALAQAAQGQELFARKAELDYQLPAKFDDLLDVGVRCTGFGISSMFILTEIYRGDTHLLTAKMTYVYVDRKKQKATAIPDSWREIINRSERL